jgi:hypothetical protein
MIVLSWITIVLIISILSIYKIKQTKNSLGGQMAWSKSFWLAFTLISWFFLPIIFNATNNGLSIDFLFLTKVLTMSMWIRGIIELFMLFKFRNWNPIYGVTHTFLTFVICAIILFNSKILGLELIYSISLLIGLILETYYAIFFLKKIGKRTQGEESIWYANNEDPIFKLNLKITFIGNIFCYLNLFYLLIRLN